VAQILIRNIADEAVDILKRRAAASGRSLEAEVRRIIEGEGERLARREEAVRQAAEIRASFGPDLFDDSADIRHEGAPVPGDRQARLGANECSPGVN
jgi:plasmid stability protein